MRFITFPRSGGIDIPVLALPGVTAPFAVRPMIMQT